MLNIYNVHVQFFPDYKSAIKKISTRSFPIRGTRAP